ncbi:MAG: sigma-70 family RNA polymerase sigma factor [Chitinophagaceae bacterium]|nr:MAG: sigma-70 family RNA polymerase sigma factor [Chitinophagaceae bacterium]
MTAEKAYNNYYSLLYSIAYQFLKSKEDAEDIVQETFLKWMKVDKENVQNSKAYLIKAVKNACINFLEDIKRKKVEALAEINFQISNYQLNIENSYSEMEKELTEVYANMLKKLNSKEQAVFVLKSSFNFSYNDITELIGTTSENARKIFQRAKVRMQDDAQRFEYDKNTFKSFFPSFFKAYKYGDVCDYINVLKSDFSNWMDKKNPQS